MAYTKTNWVNGASPPISAANLNNIENGIYNCDNAINHMATYSTSEIPVGTWIDGKTIYRKVIDLGEIGTSSTLIAKYLNDGYYDTIVRFDGYKYAAGGSWCTLNSNTTAEGYWMFVDCYTYAGHNLQINIHRSATGVWNNWSIKVIIEYTKTTS